jgi:hypothetical protein
VAKINGGFNSGKIKFWRPVSGQKRRDWRKLSPEERKKLEGASLKERVKAFFKRADRTKLIAALSSVLALTVVAAVVLSLALGGGGGGIDKTGENPNAGGENGLPTEEYDRLFEFTLKDNAYELTSVKPGYAAYIIPEEYAYKPVKSIANDAFAGKNFIEVLSIPNGVTELGKGILKDLIRLGELTLPFIGANDALADLNAAYSDIARFCYIFGENNSAIPDTLTKLTINGNITKNAFKDDAGGTAANNIESIKIGGETINEYAFSGCPSLREIAVGESVITVKAYAFSDCQSLTEITVASGKLSAVAPSAFGVGLSSLTFSAYSKDDAEKAEWYTDLVRERSDLERVIRFKA